MAYSLNLLLLDFYRDNVDNLSAQDFPRSEDGAPAKAVEVCLGFLF